TTASSDAIIASVAPQQPVISRSGSIFSPESRLKRSATAWRKPRAPQVMAYWLTSARIAATAASLTSAGAGKSGKPCARFTASCSSARRVISRMTDSVNCCALRETGGRDFAPDDGCAFTALPPREADDFLAERTRGEHGKVSAWLNAGRCLRGVRHSSLLV